MNPVDHVRRYFTIEFESRLMKSPNSLTVVVTINISAKLPPSQDTLPKVKKPVSLPLGEQVCYVVHRRQRIRWTRVLVESMVECGVLHGFLLS